MGKYHTLNDLANLFGVAPSTVSRALKDNPRIGKSLRVKIQKKAKELGFRPNRFANILQTNKSRLIGMIVPDITLHFYMRIVKEVEHILSENGYELILANSNESGKLEKKIINRLIEQRVDGVLAAISFQTTNTDHFKELLNLNIPLVFFDRVDNFLPVPKIISDDYQAAFDAVTHLIKSGCSTIAHITGTKNLNNSNNRLYGYLDALQKHQIPVHDDLILYYKFDQTAIDKFLDKVTVKHPELDGIFVFNDYAANRATQHLLKIGKKIPEQISIIGFSDEPVASYMTPQLSTVQDISSKMGSMACDQLFHMIDNDVLLDEKHTISQELVLRGTTK
ncbi:MAG: LacI family DNA-binding transcriptional regulator [Cyclobacteriaceae bacterium]